MQYCGVRHVQDKPVYRFTIIFIHHWLAAKLGNVSKKAVKTECMTSWCVKYIAYNIRWVVHVHCEQQCQLTRLRQRSGTVQRPRSCSPIVYTSHCRPGSVDWCCSVCGHSESSRTWWTVDWTRHNAVGRLLLRRPLDWLAPGQSRSCLGYCSNVSTLNKHMRVQ